MTVGNIVDAQHVPPIYRCQPKTPSISCADIVAPELLSSHGELLDRVHERHCSGLPPVFCSCCCPPCDFAFRN
jgi:hypothetical protein